MVVRDIDLLKEMSTEDLVRVSISITTLNEELRRSMGHRTSTSRQKLKAIESLSNAGVPVNVMIAPIILGLNSHEIVKKGNQSLITSKPFEDLPRRMGNCPFFKPNNLLKP